MCYKFPSLSKTAVPTTQAEIEFVSNFFNIDTNAAGALLQNTGKEERLSNLARFEKVKALEESLQIKTGLIGKKVENSYQTGFIDIIRCEKPPYTLKFHKHSKIRYFISKLKKMFLGQ